MYNLPTKRTYCIKSIIVLQSLPMENSTTHSNRMKEKLQPHFFIKPLEILEANKSIFLMGSCFSDAMLSRFHQRNISANSNPFGTIYHPIPLLNELKKIIELIPQKIGTQKHSQETISSDYKANIEVFEFNSMYHSLQHAFKFSNPNKSELLQLISNTREITAKQIETASTIIITLGTAWYYQHIPTHSIVGNCHKLPSQQFLKKCSTVGDVKQLLQDFLHYCTANLSNINWIFTVSPVRHLRDGISQNLQSKSTLLCAIHELLAENNYPNVSYFPAYEILQEELNDFRFYKDDLMHPTTWTEDYIFQRFIETYYPTTEQEQLATNYKKWKQRQHITAE